jgi:hypothetical protein
MAHLRGVRCWSLSPLTLTTERAICLYCEGEATRRVRGPIVGESKSGSVHPA